jgi:hypothetical protein
MYSQGEIHKQKNDLTWLRVSVTSVQLKYKLASSFHARLISQS